MREICHLMGVALPGVTEAEAGESLDELQRLAESAGAVVAGRSLQRRPALDPATYLGSGKVEAVRAAMEKSGAGLAVVDDELKPTQQRNLEKMLDRKVLDRTQLILDIFAQRARTSEGKLQVELAQLTYLLPRLVGWGTVLSRLGGGIGTRGPGETKLETDRRLLRGRIGQLQKDIDQVAAARGMQRRTRVTQRASLAALVGYTNAGKSSLFNALTGSQVVVQDRLFATLDPTIRPVKGTQVLLADTVGFIRKLPHTLVAAFRATLEEVNQAGLRLLVADAGTPLLEEQRRTVLEVLEEIAPQEAARKPRQWLVLNKCDLLSAARRKALIKAYPGAFLVSARTGEGLDKLNSALKEAFQGKPRKLTLELPGPQAGLLARYFDRVKILSQEWSSQGVRASVSVPADFHELDVYALKTPGIKGKRKRA